MIKNKYAYFEKLFFVFKKNRNNTPKIIIEFDFRELAF